MAQLARAGQKGLTLIELLVGLAVVAVLITLAAPSFQRMITTQRLRSINAALVTDMQFARSEASSRNQNVLVRFDSTDSALTCYVILTGDFDQCDCRRQPGANVCTGPGNTEIRTVHVDRALGVVVNVPDGQPKILGFDPATGRLLVVVMDLPEPAVNPFLIEVSNTEIGGFKNALAVTGRPTVCSPGGQLSGVTSCVP